MLHAIQKTQTQNFDTSSIFLKDILLRTACILCSHFAALKKFQMETICFQYLKWFDIRINVKPQWIEAEKRSTITKKSYQCYYYSRDFLEIRTEITCLLFFFRKLFIFPLGSNIETRGLILYACLLNTFFSKNILKLSSNCMMYVL